MAVVDCEVDAWVNGHLLVGGERSKAGNRIFYPHHPHRKEELEPGAWWADALKQEMGPHDGLPDQLR